MKSYLKKKVVKTTFVVCVRSSDLLALLGGSALLSAFIWNCPALLGEISVVNSEIPAKEGWPSSNINENKL